MCVCLCVYWVCGGVGVCVYIVITVSFHDYHVQIRQWKADIDTSLFFSFLKVHCHDFTTWLKTKENSLKCSWIILKFLRNTSITNKQPTS